jgi:ABC-type polysaccharide/polyol phosphate export permease
MSGLIEAFRNSLIGKNPIDWNLLFISLIIILTIVIIGIYYFKKAEKFFADVI